MNGTLMIPGCTIVSRFAFAVRRETNIVRAGAVSNASELGCCGVRRTVKGYNCNCGGEISAVMVTILRGALKP